MREQTISTEEGTNRRGRERGRGGEGAAREAWQRDTVGGRGEEKRPLGSGAEGWNGEKLEHFSR